MLEVNADEVKKREYDLIHFKGFIPFDFFMYIDMMKRNNYLKSVGLFKNVEKENAQIRKGMNNSNDADLYLETVLRGWIRDNPTFKYLVVEQ